VSEYRLGEFHPFTAGGKPFVYLVPSGGIFEVEGLASELLRRLDSGPRMREELLHGLPAGDAAEVLDELLAVRAIENGQRAADPPQEPVKDFPLQTMVLNLTNQCNLSCQYCYEFGEDKIATPEGKKKFMDSETARQSVDYLFAQSAGRRAIHITFFGGETLMNFPLLKEVVEYASGKAREEGRYLDYSLTTNATLLTPSIIEFLATNNIGVTVSIDGDKQQNDAFRVFANGRGSYDVIAPKIRQLLDSHKTRPIAARVTLTSQVARVLDIYRHLKQDLGFHEVGFAPVTTASNRLHALGSSGLDDVLTQFRILAEEYRQYALRGELHGFSNVSDTLAELHQGISKSHPCGAGLGLIGVGPSGDLAPCHRFVDSDTHSLGHISHGIDRVRQSEFLDRGHINAKYDCHSCWARPVCAGGCHHEAYVRYGDTGHPNLHYCDWIRDWTNLCLEIYGEIASTNPNFLRVFDQRKASS